MRYENLPLPLRLLVAAPVFVYLLGVAIKNYCKTGRFWA